jgi:hypothetical protein
MQARPSNSRTASSIGCVSTMYAISIRAIKPQKRSSSRAAGGEISRRPLAHAVSRVAACACACTACHKGAASLACNNSTQLTKRFHAATASRLTACRVLGLRNFPQIFRFEILHKFCEASPLPALQLGGDRGARGARDYQRAVDLASSRAHQLLWVTQWGAWNAIETAKALGRLHRLHIGTQHFPSLWVDPVRAHTRRANHTLIRI